jgi:hypothetical protein
MKNIALSTEIDSGKVYMVETQDGKTDSYRVLTETPTHYIFSFSNEESVEVFEKAKKEIVGIYDVKEWLDSQPS